MNEVKKITICITIFSVLILLSNITGYIIALSKHNPTTNSDNTEIDREITDIKQSITDRFAAIDERFTSLSGTLSAIPGELAKIRSGLAGLAGNIQDSIDNNREVIEQLQQLGTGINGIEKRIRSAQIGANKINTIIGDIESANSLIEKAITDPKSMDLGN